jgi:hypothetical protein
MPRREELSLDAMLADPIVRDLMAADGIDPDQVKALLRSVGRPAGKRNRSAAFGNLFTLCAGATPPKAADRDRSDVPGSRTALADCSTLSTAPVQV